MRTLSDVKRFLRRSLGKDATDIFAQQMDDVLYYARALSLSDLESDPEEIEGKFYEISQGILADLAGVYLHDNYDDNINVDYDRVYDHNMNVIKPIQDLQDNQQKIQSIMVKSAMALFRRGRKMAYRIVKRYEEHMAIRRVTRKQTTQRRAPAGRDYAQTPPSERYEIEILRLERKLPDLSPEEGQRLSLLYKYVQRVPV